jgi:hypothetical protein
MLFSMVSLLLQQVKTAGIAGHRSLMPQDEEYYPNLNHTPLRGISILL